DREGGGQREEQGGAGGRNRLSDGRPVRRRRHHKGGEYRRGKQICRGNPSPGRRDKHEYHDDSPHDSHLNGVVPNGFHVSGACGKEARAGISKLSLTQNNRPSVSSPRRDESRRYEQITGVIRRSNVVIRSN